MTFLDTIDGCRVIVQSIGEDTILGTNHLWVSQPDYDAADQLALANAVNGVLLGSGLKGVVDDAITWRVKTVDERTYDGAIVYNTGSVAGGESGGQKLSDHTACITTLYTAKRGRAYRGRLYFFGFTEQSWDGFQYDAGVAAACLTFLFGFQEAVEALGWTWGVRTAQQDGVKRAHALIEPVISYTVRSRVPGSQRRRERRP